MKRREFLSRSAATAAAISFPTIIPRHVLAADGVPGANDRIQLGFIGVGGRAAGLMTDESFPGAEIVAVADCYKFRYEQAASKVPGGDKWHKYQNYQELLEKEKLDAVFVETTTHARARIMVHAMQAGLDVYGEKPMSLTIQEGRHVVNAVKKYNKVFQTGSQQRSMPANMHACKLIHEGAIGKVHTVVVCNFEPGKVWAPPSPNPDPVPDGLDWDAWCNQTELRPYYELMRKSWGEYVDFDGGGQCWGVTGWGTHSLDQAQAGLGTDDTGPLEIWPEEQGPLCKITMRFANGTLLKLEGAKREGNLDDLGAIFIGDKGKIEIIRGSFTCTPEDLHKDSPANTPLGAHETTPHITNFLECVRSRQKPNADVETGHRATTLCHLVNICRTVQRKLQWDPKAEQFVGDEEANKLLSRPRRKGYELPELT